MTLTELRYVIAVARERHFGRAAHACFVSQPTLSVAIKKLEEELGVTLFERRKQEVKTTSMGERIVVQALRVLDESEILKRIAAEAQDPLVGPLRLGAIYTIAPYLLPQLIPMLHERAPHMPLVIEENYTGRLRQRLKQGELDAVIVALPFDEPGVETTPLYEEPFIILLPAAHPWRGRQTIAAAELAQENLLLLGAGHCFRDQVIEVCPACLQSVSAEGSLGRAVEGGSLETIRHMVASGMGITVLPCTAAGADKYVQRLIEVRHFCPPVPKRRVALAWRQSFPRPEAIDALQQAILACQLTCVRLLDQ